jgi:beta-galactosidase GanA
VLDVWKAAAPAIAGEEPDIYGSTFADVMGQISRYHRPDNPFFVPEFGNKPWFARFFFAVLGNQALGFAPFGMDDTGYGNYPLGAPRVNDEIIAPFALDYSIIAPMMREWAKISLEKPIWGVAEPDDHASQTETLGRWLLTVDYQQWQFGPVDKDHKNGVPPGTEKPSGGVLVAQLGPDEFLVMGVNARVSFGLADKESSLQTQFDRVEEGRYEKGQWVMDRVWNGDQTDWGLNLTTAPQVLRVKLATF